jgi:hypothetical protein
MCSHWPCICTYLLTRVMRKLEGEVGDKTMLFTCTPCNRVLGALSPAASVTPIIDTIRTVVYLRSPPFCWMRLFYISYGPHRGDPIFHLQARGKAKLISQTNRHLRVFQHVGKADSADRVLSGVDVATGVLERALNNKSRWVAGLGCTCMVRASISALRLDVGNGTVLWLVRRQAPAVSTC